MVNGNFVMQIGVINLHDFFDIICVNGKFIEIRKHLTIRWFCLKIMCENFKKKAGWFQIWLNQPWIAQNCANLWQIQLNPNCLCWHNFRCYEWIDILNCSSQSTAILSHLTTIAGPWYFWQGIRTSKAHKPVTLSGNATFTKV